MNGMTMAAQQWLSNAGAAVAMAAATTRFAVPLDVSLRRFYLASLRRAFALFSAARILAYLPLIWALHDSGDASAHSPWTWCIWIGANTTMGLSMLEQGAGAARRNAAVCAANAVMCAIVLCLILVNR